MACNATNSAAIDNEGNLFVWGLTKYGLCGSPAIHVTKESGVGIKKKAQSATKNL